MAVLLALATAVVYGSADFLGGLAARRVRGLLVVGWAQLAGVGLVATERGPGAAPGAARATTAALVAGTAFGAMFVLLHRTSPASGLWPLVGSRGASAVPAALLLLARPPLRRAGL